MRATCPSLRCVRTSRIRGHRGARPDRHSGADPILAPVRFVVRVVRPERVSRLRRSSVFRERRSPVLGCSGGLERPDERCRMLLDHPIERSLPGLARASSTEGVWGDSLAISARERNLTRSPHSRRTQTGLFDGLQRQRLCARHARQAEPGRFAERPLEGRFRF